MFNKAVEEKKREKAYQRWIVREPHYTQENYQTFEEFYEMLYPPKVNIDTRSKDEIMNELLGKEG